MQRNGASLSAAGRRFRAGRSTEEAGFALMVVLGVVLFLSIAGLAVMSLTVAANGASGSLTKASDATRAIDSAFEQAIQKWRVDPALVNASCAAATSPDTPIQRATDVVKVTCADGLPPTADIRVLDLTATRVPAIGGSGPVVGLARVKITDRINGSSITGYSIVVCDWILGNPGARALKACPT